MKLTQSIITFLVLIAMFVSAFFIHEKMLLIALGIAFVIIGVWLIPSLALEIAFFGSIISLVEWWKYWGNTVFNLSPLPDSIYIFSAAFIATWVIMMLINVSSYFIPFLVPFNTFLRKTWW